jgi:hypothetical protein
VSRVGKPKPAPDYKDGAVIIITSFYAKNKPLKIFRVYSPTFYSLPGAKAINLWRAREEFFTDNNLKILKYMIKPACLAAGPKLKRRKPAGKAWFYRG